MIKPSCFAKGHFLENHFSDVRFYPYNSECYPSTNTFILGILKLKAATILLCM